MVAIDEDAAMILDALQINRRQFLRGGALVAGAGGAASVLFLPTLAAADCVATSGTIGGNRQRTLEAAANVMLPKGGTHGATGSGVLDAVVYGKKVYAHLVDSYYANQITQSDLDAAVTDLSNGSICMALTTSYWRLGCSDQLGLMAYGSRRSDEGAAPNVSSWEALCLVFGQLFAPTLSNPTKAYDLARFMGLIFYGSPQGFSHMATFGYPGPNWGFDSATCGWIALGAPTFPDLTEADLICDTCRQTSGPWPSSVHPDTLL
jgi:hypothetical protein